MTTAEILRAPFPYFGGKSRIAGEVWARFGDPPNFVQWGAWIRQSQDRGCRPVRLVLLFEDQRIVRRAWVNAAIRLSWYAGSWWERWVPLVTSSRFAMASLSVS